MSATSTITSAANITGGNLLTGGLISATSTITSAANITGGNILTGGQVSATGNVSGNYLRSTLDTIVGGNISTTNLTGTGVSVTANVSGGNIRTAGQVSATGNITGAYYFGNGSQLTGIGSSYGDSNVVTLLSAFGSNTISTTGTITSGANITGGNLATGGTVSATGNITGGNLVTGGTIAVTGASTAGSYSTSGNVTAGNLVTGGTIAVTGASTAGSYSTSGNVTGGNINTNGTTGILSVNSITHTGTTGVGNIGATGAAFNTVFATATTALYADLAENYLSDADYVPGTVVVFGGEQEITVTGQAADERVAGVVSTNPAYLMNSGEPGLPIALRGKVPVRVIGPVTKGDSLVTSTTPGVAFSVGRERVYGQAVFAKSLESNDTDNEKVILAVIL
jgi:hypothetical protein